MFGFAVSNRDFAKFTAYPNIHLMC